MKKIVLVFILFVELLNVFSCKQVVNTTTTKAELELYNKAKHYLKKEQIDSALYYFHLAKKQFTKKSCASTFKSFTY